MNFLARLLALPLPRKDTMMIHEDSDGLGYWLGEVRTADLPSMKACNALLSREDQAAISTAALLDEEWKWSLLEAVRETAGYSLNDLWCDPR